MLLKNKYTVLHWISFVHQSEKYFFWNAHKISTFNNSMNGFEIWLICNIA